MIGGIFPFSIIYSVIYSLFDAVVLKNDYSIYSIFLIFLAALLYLLASAAVSIIATYYKLYK